jgi:hypothetical protein
MSERRAMKIFEPKGEIEGYWRKLNYEEIYNFCF